MDAIAERVPNFYWCIARDATGPVLFILGPLLLMRRLWQRAAALIAAIGCCILTVATSWMFIDVALHENPSNRALGFSITGALCAIAVLADVAGVKIWRAAFHRSI